MDTTEEPRVDLTTGKGIQALRNFINSPLGIATNPGASLLLFLFDSLSKESEVSPNNQGEVAKQIIETARKNGVKKLRIKIDKSAGVKVKANLKDANVGAVDIGSDGSMELSIEF